MKGNKGNTSSRRYKGGAPLGPRVRWLRLAEADALLLEPMVAPLSLEDALRRLAASAAADSAGTRAALAPLVAIEAWDDEIL